MSTTTPSRRTRSKKPIPDYAEWGFPPDPLTLVKYAAALLRSKRELYEEERGLAADILECVGRSAVAMKAIRPCFPQRRATAAKRAAIDYLVQLELVGPRQAKRVAKAVADAHGISEKSVPTYLTKWRSWATRARDEWIRLFDPTGTRRRDVLENISADVRSGECPWIK